MAPSGGRSPRLLALAVGLVAFAAAAAFGLATHRTTPLAVDPATAVRVAAQAPETRAAVARADGHRVTAIDDDLVKVTWLRHGRVLATAGVRPDGRVFQPTPIDGHAGYGAALSHSWIALAGLTALFLLATLGRGRRRDALLLAGLVVPATLVDRGYNAPGEALVAVLLVALIARCVTVAVRGPEAPGAPGVPSGPVLLERLPDLPNLPRRFAWLLAAVTVLVTLTSNGIVDVAPATVEGATQLLHGRLPYGNLPGDVVHGDTYGLPIYMAYAPFAALWPMHDDWDSSFAALLVAALLVPACALGMARAAARDARWPAIVAFLALPAGLMTFSSGTNDMLIAAALLWALAWFARPARSSALLMAAGLAKVAPLVLLPLWLARLRGAALARAVAACAATGAVVLAALVALGGIDGPADMVHAMSFQLSRTSMMSTWTALGIEGLQPLAQAAALALALGSAALVLQDRAVAADPRRVAALITAVLAALQVAASHWAPLYLVWLVPPALVALHFGRPGPAAATPPGARPAEAPAEPAPRAPAMA